jgi:hypothetical protein
MIRISLPVSIFAYSVLVATTALAVTQSERDELKKAQADAPALAKKIAGACGMKSATYNVATHGMDNMAGLKAEMLKPCTDVADQIASDCASDAELKVKMAKLTSVSCLLTHKKAYINAGGSGVTIYFKPDSNIKELVATLKGGL